MLDSNGNGMHHEDDDDLFTDSDPVLPDPSQMGAHDGILLREWRRYMRSLSLLLSPRSDRSGPAQFAITAVRHYTSSASCISEMDSVTCD
ncbi:hypothetical protein ZWY2020_029431 [Hordeum vulgare]|nr:hypothetical protein ZWY2020_029431 [Hordeum vulgare]